MVYAGTLPDHTTKHVFKGCLDCTLGQTTAARQQFGPQADEIDHLDQLPSEAALPCHEPNTHSMPVARYAVHRVFWQGL